MAKTEAKFEETHHYGGEAVVKFYPGMHGYFVTDPKLGYKHKRMGGGTSITGMLAKGQGLMLYPMYEMRKYLKNYFRSTTVEEFFDAPMNLDDLLKAGTQAHVKKSDRGKSVGTDAHAWVEEYVREAMRVQEKLKLKDAEEVSLNREAYDKEFKCPEILEVEELHAVLRRSYIDIFKASKPTSIDEYRKLSKALFADAEIQEALHTEATMLRQSITAAKEWFDRHDVYVHGTEDTVYSREYGFCGKYDIDITVRCSRKCEWCYLNKPLDKRVEFAQSHKDGEDHVFEGRYIADFKSTNESTEAPKGIYKEYLTQCAVYEIGKTEEFPDIKYDGHLILNGSKNNGTFNSHFSFSADRSRRMVELLVELKELDYEAKQEMKASA